MKVTKCKQCKKCYFGDEDVCPFCKFDQRSIVEEDDKSFPNRLFDLFK